MPYVYKSLLMCILPSFLLSKQTKKNNILGRVQSAVHRPRLPMLFMSPQTLHCRYMRTSMKVHHSFTPPTIYLSRYFPHPLSSPLPSLSRSAMMCISTFFISVSLLLAFKFSKIVFERISKCQIDSLILDNER